MATWVERIWNPDNASVLSSRDKKPGRYRAFVPDELPLALPSLGFEARERADEALAALIRADERVHNRASFLNHLLIRSESISSSWIEGNRISFKRLAIAEALSTGTRAALDVIGNVRATEQAIDLIATNERAVTVTDIEELQHRIEPRLEKGIRQEQNWVGGTGNSPLRAQFVPPPESEVRRLLANLAAFISVNDGNPVIRAALAHAQFETIHPFVDGNGRTGRALIHTVLKRCDTVQHTLIPISTVFAAHPDRYIDGLTVFRREPPGIDEWVTYFAESASTAAADAVELCIEVEQVDRDVTEKYLEWRRHVGKSPVQPRRGAVAMVILGELAEHQVLTISGVSERHNVSGTAAHGALSELEEAGVLNRAKDHKGKTVCWTSPSHLALLEKR